MTNESIDRQPHDPRTATAFKQLGISSVSELHELSEDELITLLSEYNIDEPAHSILLQSHRDAHFVDSRISLSNNHTTTAGQTDKNIHDTFSPIALGVRERHDRFGTTFTDPAELPFDESGLRRHLQIVGSSGSGKTVAARFIIEQAALARVPSLVFDCQGDLSSLVFVPNSLNRDDFFTNVHAIHSIDTHQQENDLRTKIVNHFNTLEMLELNDNQLQAFSNSIRTRIFTPKRPDLGLSVALPPYSAEALTAHTAQQDDIDRQELIEHAQEERLSLVSQLFAKLSVDKKQDYVELLGRIVDHAIVSSLDLSGSNGIDTLIRIADQSMEIAPDLFDDNLSDTDLKKLKAAINRLKYDVERPWLKGAPLDISRLISMNENRTPINIINVHGLAAHDQRRTLRAIIGAVYRYAIQHPKFSGPPSMILFIDEVGTGFGEQSIAVKSATDNYRVYQALQRLVFQARKYGVSIILASQNSTHFSPPIRQNLSTKILGRITDGGEQNRVIKALCDDSTIAGQSTESFVQTELQGLSPPRLILLNTNGLAYAYHQNKCFTLDITMKTRDINNWRNFYERELDHELAELVHNLGSHDPIYIIARLSTLRNEYDFLARTPSQLIILLINTLISVHDVSGALATLNTLSDRSLPEDILTDLVINFASKDGIHITEDLSELLHTVLQKWDGVPSESAAAEKLRMLLLRFQISAHSPDKSLILGLADSLSSSASSIVRILATTWRLFTDAFSSCNAAWKLATASGDAPARLYYTTPEGTAECRVLETESGATEPIESVQSIIEKSPETFSLESRISKYQSQNSTVSVTIDEFQNCYKLIASTLREASFKLSKGDTNSTIAAIDTIDESVLRITDMDSCPDLVNLVKIDSHPRVRKARLRSWLNSLTWRQFEYETARLFISMGYDAMVCKGTNDDGVDVYAKRNDDYVVIQCKHWRSTSVGKTIVQAIRAKATEENAAHAAVVTSGQFEPGAAKWAIRNDVDIIDGDRFIELVMMHYMSAHGQHDDPDRSRIPRPPTHNEQEHKEERIEDSPLPTTTLFPVVDHNSQNTIIELVKSRGSVVNADIRAVLGVDTNQATTLLRKLCDSGILVMVGIKRGARYYHAQSLEKTTSISMDIADDASSDSQDDGSTVSAMTGVVDFYNQDRRFGKIAGEDSAIDLYFFHATHLEDPLDELFISQGVRVRFMPKATEKGPQATDIKLELSDEAKYEQTIFRTGSINLKEDFYAFVTDKLSSLSLYLPRNIVEVEAWNKFNVDSVVRYDVAPSPNPEHFGKWEITSIYNVS